MSTARIVSKNYCSKFFLPRLMSIFANSQDDQKGENKDNVKAYFKGQNILNNSTLNNNTINISGNIDISQQNSIIVENKNSQNLMKVIKKSSNNLSTFVNISVLTERTQCGASKDPIQNFKI